MGNESFSKRVISSVIEFMSVVCVNVELAVLMSKSKSSHLRQSAMLSSMGIIICNVVDPIISTTKCYCVK